MLRAALGFFIIAVIAFALGLGGIAGLSMEIARILIVVFLILALLSGVFHMVRLEGTPAVDAAVGFFVLALIALALGYGGVAGVSMEIAYILIGVFLVLSLISAIVHISGGTKRVTRVTRTRITRK